MGNPTPKELLIRDALLRKNLHNMTTFTSEDLKNALINSKIVEEAPYHPGYEDAAMGPIAFDEDKDYKECNLADVIRANMKRDKKRFWAGDNISDYLHEGDKEILIKEATLAFEKVLDTLLIDRENDPNSHGTAKRLAKMYFNEIMAGRYEQSPDCTAFPNDSEDRYEGMLVVRSELRSMCSHHHQPVTGVAYIGIIAAQKLIGLSKYTRIAQWCARRGTLQEELCNDIAKEIMKATGSKDVGVYIQAIHGCCENRGIMAHSSLTQTTVLKGAFTTDAGTKKEFMDNIKLQQDFAPR
jgi:GTP cyclohydrolase I